MIHFTGKKTLRYQEIIHVYSSLQSHLETKKIFFTIHTMDVENNLQSNIKNDKKIKCAPEFFLLIIDQCV